MENFWTHCLERFKKELSAQQFNTWIKPLKFEHDQHKIKILAPNKFVQQWVKDRFAQKIEVLAKEQLPDVTKVEERSVRLRRSIEKSAGGIGSANADISNDKEGEKPSRRKPKVSQSR